MHGFINSGKASDIAVEGGSGVEEDSALRDLVTRGREEGYSSLVRNMSAEKDAFRVGDIFSKKKSSGV